MKYIIETSITKSVNLPHKFTINKVDVHNKPDRVHLYNYFFINICQKLDSQILK